MGQEIERARSLLTAVARSGLLPADAAGAAYEAWVAAGDATPFSRFLIDQRGVDAEGLRRVLRLLAVQGLPNPELHTYERFEDLLLAQLGIEAGMLSGKLVASVRAVQDKKVAEGKMRRLSELLPRAGFDKSMLDLLHQHLSERILLCRGCLGRYPRRDLAQQQIECPRCGASIGAEALEPSELLVVSAEQKQLLLASSEYVLETGDEEPVQSRQEPSARARGKSKDTPMILAVAMLSVLVVGGGVALVLLEADTKRPGPRPIRRTVKTPDRPDRPEPARPSGGDASVATGDAVTVGDARQADARLLGEGRYEEMLATWRKVKPGPGEDPGEVQAQKKRRIAELEVKLALSREAARAVAAGDRPLDAVEERRLARILDRAPPSQPPPFDALAGLLGRLAQARAAETKALAQRRFEEAQRRVSPEAGEWKRRTERAAQVAPLFGVRVGARLVDGVRIKALGPKRFRISTAEGEVAASWADAPRLGVQLLAAVAQDDSRPDQRELLYRSLVARMPLSAERAKQRLGVELDLQPLLASAPTSSPLVSLGEGRHQLRYALGWVPFDLDPVTGTTLRSEGDALLLDGTPCAVMGRPLPLIDKRPSVSVEAALSGGKGQFLALVLHGRSSKRRYVVRWGQDRWRLGVDFGSGSTAVAEGELSGNLSGPARLTLEKGEVVFALGGLPRGRAAISTQVSAASVGVGADSGPLRVTELLVEGDLDAQAFHSGETRYMNLVQQRVRTLTGGGAAADADDLPPLTAESPQELALASDAALGQLDQAKRQAAGGDLDGAARTLASLEASSPKLVAASYYRAWVALRRGDVAGAVTHAVHARTLLPEFDEAWALEALALALAGRKQAEERARKALDGRPDLAAAYLARAWLVQRTRDPKQPVALDEVQDEALDMAVKLAPGDPLIGDLVRRLRGAVELESGFQHRLVGKLCVVLTRSQPEQARALLPKLDKLLASFAKHLGRAQHPAKLRLAIVDADELAVLAGPDSGRTSFDPLGGFLFSQGVPRDLEDPALVRTLAVAYLAAREGALPDWLLLGLGEWLVDQITPGVPVDQVKLLLDQGKGSAADWSELFGARLATLQRLKLARARAWGLVRAWPKRVDALRAAAAAGEPVVLELDVDALEADLAKLLVRLDASR